jgi:hypothetical protein
VSKDATVPWEQAITLGSKVRADLACDEGISDEYRAWLERHRDLAVTA